MTPQVIDQFVRAQATVPKEWGGLAVVWDKNEMEATGYAAVMADLCGEEIHLAEYRENDQDPPVKWIDGIPCTHFPVRSSSLSQIHSFLLPVIPAALFCG